MVRGYLGNQVPIRPQPHQGQAITELLAQFIWAHQLGEPGFFPAPERTGACLKLVNPACHLENTSSTRAK